MIERLQIDWTRCEARGLCVELIPELFDADDWGYPLSRTGEHAPALTRQTARYARAAVAECPRLALRIHAEPGDGGPGRSR